MARNVEGVAAVRQAIAERRRRVEEATKRAVTEGGAVILRQAQQNASGRPGPNVRTGAHRRSFVMVGPESDGPGRWSVGVGPTMVYSRALEEGHPRWPAGVRYPSLGPAAAYAEKSVLPGLFARHWERANAE